MVGPRFGANARDSPMGCLRQSLGLAHATGSVLLLLVILLCTSLPLEAGRIKYTYDDAGRLVKAEYANGVAISYTYDPAGNLLSRRIELTTVDLYFPFYQSHAAAYTGIGISNYSERAAGLQMSLFGAAGQPLAGNTNPASLQLPAGNQLARLGSELFGVDPSTVQSGWVQVTSDNADIGNLFQFGGPDQLDGSVAFIRQSKKLYFSRVFQGVTAFRGQTTTTQLSIANPNTQPVTLRLRLLGPSGQSLSADRNETIAAKGVLFRSVAELFDGTGPVSSGYIVAEVTSGEGIVGFELISLPARNTVIGLNASTGETAGTLYSAQMAHGRQSPGISFFTDLKLINAGTSSRTASLQVFAEDGTPLAPPVNVTLGAGEILERDAGELFGLGSATGSALRVGSIRVQADGPGLIGDVLFGDPGFFNFAAALPLQFTSFTRAIFSQVANALGYFTGLALYNPGTTTAQVTIEVYTETGVRNGQAEVPLGGGRRVSRLLTELLPSTDGQLRGYIVLQSTQPLIAQELFGDVQLSFLSAVPPTIVQ